MRFSIALMMTMAILAACGQSGLRELTSDGEGPDEFLILPTKPLEQPANLTELPKPTPGAANLSDATPKAEAIAALGGNAAALDAANVPARDGALVLAAGRFGVEENVRADLAQADADFRRRENRTARFKLFRVDRYSEAYRRQALNPNRQNRIFRRAGIETPAAPPAN
ncbi:Beta-barrel assembly machine subunit BamF [Epibacterium ulvae]|uniref:Beta-barrel assembly machine subunit BamF n=1 Tax=Epibacterium ulvae TaxID=1156985 RepID=A0A1G5QYI8_9RHOB|nr:DUF3035 domain-containing protein [Epibacterium ulvae]SCZ66658.1 Beta-barrel assembly machine subunit BamF [Epibacterium ulvae]